MSKEKSENTEIKIEELDEIPPIGLRNSVYDEALDRSIKATKDTISIQIENKTPSQLYNALHGRILKYNQNPDRNWDLLLAQRKELTYIKRKAKGSLARKDKKANQE